MSSQDTPAQGPAGDGPPAQSDSAAPPGYGTVTPWIISPDTARLIDFAKAAFGAQELARLPGPDGDIGHAEIRIGDSVVMMFDARDGWPDTPAFDDRMIVTPFLYRARGFEHPALQLRRLSPFGMFERYAAQFEDVWATVRPLT